MSELGQEAEEGNASTPGGDNRPVAWLWGFWTLHNIALVIFVGLALAIGIIAVRTIVYPGETGSDPFAVSRTLAVLLIASLACAVMAWLDHPNATMLGRGLRHLLTIQRAAVASFIVSGTATIGVAIFVALTALFSGELKRGLYALASIEFLLKLTAVSAIVVLITLRKPSVRRTTAVQQAAPEPNGGVVVVEDEEEEDRGRLEFGNLAFAFSLVVIAGLIVPSEDLMRLASMFFGGEKKVEDYLPQRPLVSVEDDLSGQIVEAIEGSLPMRQMMGRMIGEDQLVLTNALKLEVESVLHDVVMDGVRRIGAWPLLEDICHDRADTMIFSNADERLLAEHLTYLAAEGLVEYPYGDINSLELTRYGNLVVSKYTGQNCAASADQAVPTQMASSDSLTLSPRVSQIDVNTSGRTIDQVPFSETMGITNSGMVVQLSLEEGEYRASLIASDRVDPFLQLFDADGALRDENDDDPDVGALNSAITFRVGDGEKLFLRVSSYDNRQGDALLRIEPATIEVDPASEIIDEQIAVPLTAQADVPTEGVVFYFRAQTTGEHIIQTALPPGSQPGDTDLVAVLFRISGQQREQIAFDDDSGFNNFPALSAELTADETYLLVLRHYEAGAQKASVSISVSPPVSTTDASGQPLMLDGPPATVDSGEDPTSTGPQPDTAAEPAPAAEPVPAAEPAPTGSPGS